MLLIFYVCALSPDDIKCYHFFRCLVRLHIPLKTTRVTYLAVLLLQYDVYDVFFV